MAGKTLSGGIDRHTYQPTGIDGFEFRYRADGSKTFYGFVPGRGRTRLESRTIREARAEWDELRGKAAKGETIPRRNVRFRDLEEPWFESKRRITESTREAYRHDFALVGRPYLGNRPVSSIDAELLARLQHGLADRGLNYIDRKRPVRSLSRSQVDNYMKPIRGMLDLAVRRKIIAFNPASLLTDDDLPEASESKAYEWSGEEIASLLRASEEIAALPTSRQDYSPIIRLAVESGLRLSELLGLQWGDIDFDKERPVLYVHRQFSKRLRRLTAPKTKKSIRRVPLTAQTRASLLALRMASTHSQDSDFVFVSHAGGPLSHRNVQRRGFEKARDRAGLSTTITFHALRHAFASVAAHRGVPVNVLSEVMGHENTSTTERIYIHLYGRESAEDAFRTAMGQ